MSPNSIEEELKFALKINYFFLHQKHIISEKLQFILII